MSEGMSELMRREGEGGRGRKERKKRGEEVHREGERERGRKGRSEEGIGGGSI